MKRELNHWVRAAACTALLLVVEMSLVGALNSRVQERDIYEGMIVLLGMLGGFVLARLFPAKCSCNCANGEQAEPSSD